MALLETPDEIRAFEYYRNKSSLVLGGITMENDDFWDGLVVKLTATEPAVRHAVLALSSLHERISSSDPAGKKSIIKTSDFAFSEYGKAIAAVRSWDMQNTGAQPAAIPLLVCVLFICIEFLLDYDAAAQIHIRQGRFILSRMSQANESSPTMDMVRKVLVPIYARLGLASNLFASRPEPIPASLVVREGEVPMSLDSMKDARNTLYHIIDDGLRFTFQAKPAVYDPATELWQFQVMELEQDRLLAKLAKWNAAYTILKAAQITESSSSKAMQDLLLVYFHAAKIWISTALATAETAYDDHETSFAAMVSYSASALAASGSLQKEDAAFTFETEMLPPVYWTAVKCRNPLIRRAALRLLSREEMKRRRENLWHARELIVISSHLIQVEEDGTDDVVSDDILEGLDEDHRRAKGYWHSEMELRVPVTQAPMLRRKNEFTEEELDEVLAGHTSLESTRGASPSSASPRSQDMEPGTSAGIDPASLQAPYGVPEANRVQNALIGLTKNTGVWLTKFYAPKPGEAEWNVKKILLKVPP